MSDYGSRRGMGGVYGVRRMAATAPPGAITRVPALAEKLSS